jgi:leader peptidase (prepilin peptidase)/N-methyltransferase
MVAYGLCGLLMGGLINVLADALPRRERPGAPACRVCGRRRPWFGWLAAGGYLLARGRCVGCGARLPWRHLFTELAAALLFVFLWRRYGPSARLLFETLYTAVFVLIFVTDAEHRLILHVTTLPAIGLAIAGSFFLTRWDYNWRLALLGGATGFILVWGMYLLGRLFTRLVERTRGQKVNEVAFGFGDVTLATFIGLVVGFPNVIYALLVGVLLAGAGGAIYWLIQAAIRRNYSLFTAMPYGPFLIAGGWTAMIWGRQLFG